jgi:Arc/MetJ-type ribon-helix-helix transcriptional regulator
LNEKLNIELTSRQAESLRRLVASGEYGKPDEVLAEALDEWLLRHGAEFGDAEVLKKLWDQGMGSGAAEPIDFGKLREEARHRLEAAKRGR